MKMVFLDVDDTLYQKGKGPFAHVSGRINSYVMNWCGIEMEEAQVLRGHYIITYGSTLGGLMAHHGVDPNDYLRDVHDVPVEDMLKPDSRLREVLVSIPYKMVLFSNGSIDYVRRVIDALGVGDLFYDLFTIEYMDFIPKPRSYPYQKLMELYGRERNDCIVVDDRIPNILTAVDMGMTGILVGEEELPGDAKTIETIYAITDVID